MKRLGDQLHDTLHNTRVRREVAENERQAFAEEASQELNELYSRFEGALSQAQQTKQDAAPAFVKSKELLLSLHQQARQELEQILSDDADAWYPRRDTFVALVEELRQEVHTVESLSSP